MCPDFSVKPKIANKIQSIRSVNTGRINAALGDILGKPFVGEENVFDILNETEDRRYNCEYGYSEQKSIGQKPVLTFTGEGLKKYNFSITLHHSFCRPDYIIQELQAKGESGEPFSYYQGQKYIGEFVINNIDINPVDEYEDVTLCAVLGIEILEYIQELDDEDYDQQTKTQVEIPENKIKSLSTSVPTTPVEAIKSNPVSVFETLTETVIDKALRNAESYINSSIGGIAGGLL